ncbi:MAG: ankyrin repeat domain-containing protein [Flavitalea sp.]
MKYLLSGFLLISTGAFAQKKNVFLEQSFWQTKPTVEAVKAEIAKGNDPAELNPSNFDPVVMAINSSAPNETVKFLMEQKGNEVNKLTHDGRTYIFWSASRGNTDLMEYLISKGAQTNLEDNHGYSVLNFAAVGGQQNTKVYDLCIKNGSDLKKELTHDGANALLLVTANDSAFTLTNYFVKKGLSLKSTDAEGNTAFNYAARGGNIENMKALLAKGIKPTDNAMIMAAQGSRRGANKLEVFQYLESVGVKPTAVSKNGDNVLHSIVRRPGGDDLVKFFLSKGVKVDQANNEGNTVFMNAAAYNRDLATLEALRAQIKDINQANKAGQTALTLAVGSNSPQVVQYLLEKGAKADVVDAKGENLASYLVGSYNPRTAKDFEAKIATLKNSGFDVTTPQKDGSTLFHLAMAKNDLALLKLVNDLKVDVNAKTKEGVTALHKAAMVAKDDTILKYLVSIGANKTIATSFNETAFDLASENENITKQNIQIGFLK